MAIKIITDSTSDIPIGEAKNLDIVIAPLTVSFGEQTFRDGVDITPIIFYSMLKTAKVMPTTSQVTVGAFIDIFNEISPHDDIIVITISSKLSGTYQSACIAKNSVENGNKIIVIDSFTVTGGIAILVNQAVKMRNAGKTATEIVTLIEGIKHRVRVFATLSTLKYLHKGGRLSGASAIAGTMLGIKPIIEIKKGEVCIANKVRGSKAAYQWIGSELKKTGVQKSLPLYFMQADAQKEIQEFMGEVGRVCPIESAQIKDIGITIGTHIGNGGVGVAYLSKKL